MLDAQHPAPHAGVVILPDEGTEVVSASPELFLRRDGDRLASSPIKGTGRSSADLQDKDTAENVMIVDLVRNDIGQVAVTGSVQVPSLLRHEEHPGLVHLVSTVEGRTCRVSAVCPHLGGVLTWNDAELSWDCPLHGSRFRADGRLVEGPATSDLEPRDP